MDCRAKPLGLGPGLSASGWKNFSCTYFSQDLRFRVHIAKSPVADSGWAQMDGTNSWRNHPEQRHGAGDRHQLASHRT